MLRIYLLNALGLIWKDLLCLGDEFVGIVPVSQKICCFFIIHPNIMVLKKAREEVIYFSSHIQDIAHPAWRHTAGKTADCAERSGFRDTSQLLGNNSASLCDWKMHSIQSCSPECTSLEIRAESKEMLPNRQQSSSSHLSGGSACPSPLCSECC